MKDDGDEVAWHNLGADTRFRENGQGDRNISKIRQTTELPNNKKIYQIDKAWVAF